MGGIPRYGLIVGCLWALYMKLWEIELYMILAYQEMLGFKLLSMSIGAMAGGLLHGTHHAEGVYSGHPSSRT